MPYVLRHAQTNQLFTCMLVNRYDLPYYGTKYWESTEELHGYPDFLRDRGVTDPEFWGPMELTDEQLKLCNVKLKNDPRYLLFWENGRSVVKKVE